MEVCNCSMFYCTLLCVPSSFATILIEKRELVALLNLSSWCLVIAVWLFLAVPWVCLQFVIVVFPDHTHLLFFILILKNEIWASYDILEWDLSCSLRINVWFYMIKSSLSVGEYMQQSIRYGKWNIVSLCHFGMRFKLLFKDQCLVSFDQKYPACSVGEYMQESI